MFNAVTLKYAILFNLQCANVSVYTIHDIHAIEHKMKEDTNVNNRYILGSGGHWTACVPVINGQNIEFIEINSTRGDHFHKFENVDAFLDRIKRGIAQVIIFSGQQCKPPLTNLNGNVTFSYTENIPMIRVEK